MEFDEPLSSRNSRTLSSKLVRTLSAKTWGKPRQIEPLNTAPDSAATLNNVSFDLKQPKSAKRRSSTPDLLPVTVNIMQENLGRSPNIITTAQYNSVTFLPLVLYAKFHPLKCFSNFFFLCIGALQILPAITITNGIPNQWGPLILIVAVDIAFLYFEDKARHAADAAANAQELDILRTPEGAPAKVERLTWADVGVGDVVSLASLYKPLFPRVAPGESCPHTPPPLSLNCECYRVLHSSAPSVWHVHLPRPGARQEPRSLPRRFAAAAWLEWRAVLGEHKAS